MHTALLVSSGHTGVHSSGSPSVSVFWKDYSLLNSRRAALAAASDCLHV